MGMTNVSKPDNLWVAVGFLELMLALTLFILTISRLNDEINKLLHNLNQNDESENNN